MTGSRPPCPDPAPRGRGVDARLSRRRWLAGCARWGAALLAAELSPGGFAATVPREYDVKAAFLFNFASFVDWPAQAYGDAAAPFTIGLIGDDPFGPVLDEIVAGETTRGHPLVVRRFTSRQVNEAAGCHILFVSQSEARRVRSILQAVRGRPVLTVSDVPGFLEAGGTLAFTTDASVKLSINPLAARLAGLTVSSKLLRLAHVVEREVAP